MTNPELIVLKVQAFVSLPSQSRSQSPLDYMLWGKSSSDEPVGLCLIPGYWLTKMILEFLGLWFTLPIIGLALAKSPVSSGLGQGSF